MTGTTHPATGNAATTIKTKTESTKNSHAPPEVELENIQQLRAVWCNCTKQWELHVVCEQEITAESSGEKTAGVDLGICNPAAVALLDDALLYPENTLRENEHYFQREKYQTEGPHGTSQKA